MRSNRDASLYSRVARKVVRPESTARAERNSSCRSNCSFPVFESMSVWMQFVNAWSGWTGLGFKTVEFETEWKKYAELPHAHFNSNTVGLHLAAVRRSQN